MKHYVIMMSSWEIVVLIGNEFLTFRELFLPPSCELMLEAETVIETLVEIYSTFESEMNRHQRKQISHHVIILKASNLKCMLSYYL
jgi:hypothetical protein